MIYVVEWSFMNTRGVSVRGQVSHEDQQRSESLARKAIYAQRKRIGPEASIKNGATKAIWERSQK
jgi:hypothetical protein